MLSISNLSKYGYVNVLLKVQARYKSEEHWAKLRRKVTSSNKALNHFDDFYASVFANDWKSIREALLSPSKYVAVINNYGDSEETMDHFKMQGAHCLKTLMTVQEQFTNEYYPKRRKEKSTDSDKNVETLMKKFHVDEISKLYPQVDNISDRMDTESETIVEEKSEVNTQIKSLDQSMAEAQIDLSRIVNPSMGLVTEALYQYLPATKLKGMDDWLPESLHYSFYTEGKDFPLMIEPETDFSFPEHLKVCTYEMGSEMSTFDEPRRGQTGVYNHYPMDCGSVLAVMALCLSPGDRVLDLCAAPGGKSLVALQTLLPDVIVCNDVSISRRNRMQHMFRNYLIDFEESNKWRERVILKRVDGRIYMDDMGFDKVLVDAPCTTDRVSVNEDKNNIFRPDRIRERLRIPEMQAQLLANALQLVRVGGAVVYSTCSLSPIQNDGVVHLALKRAFESRSILATVRDMSIPMSSLSSTLRLCKGEAKPKYGQLVVPSVEANFGPTYIARLVRVR